MAKWYGVVGYAELVETAPGVWKERITEKPYFGEMNPDIRRLQTSDQVNDNINISNKLSIVADPYAVGHMYTIRYAEFQGARWKVTSVEPLHPRLILTLGGLWNGEQA